MIAGLPRYCAGTNVMPALCCSNSPVTWPNVPLPGYPAVILPGFALA